MEIAELKELNKKITKYFALKSPEDKILKKKRRRFLNRGYAARVRANQNQNLNELTENVRRLEEEIAGEARRFQEMKAMMEELAEQAEEVEKLEQLETLVGPDVILLDDAFQHRRVKPSFS